MNDDPNLVLLEKAGDPFEYLICQSREALLQILQPYAQVWAEHIEPRRKGNGSHITAEWMPFAGSHYTALIRLYHAYRAKEALLALCKDIEATNNPSPSVKDYAALLEIHALSAAFWENLGSGIDNFGHAWDDARKILIGNAKKPGETGDEPISGKTISNSKYPKMSDAFDRRTQYIHWRLVPKRLEDGMVVFNLRHYDEKRTVWTPDSEKLETIDNQITKQWIEVLIEFGTAWSRLFAWLQAKDKNRPVSEAPETRTAVTPSFPSASYYADPVKLTSSFTIPPSG